MPEKSHSSKLRRKSLNQHSATDRESARLFFLLNCLQQEAPEVLENLRSDVWPSYRNMFPLKIDDHHTTIAHSLSWRYVDHWTIRWKRRRDVFVSSLQKWGERFHLNVGWIFDAALSTLWFWLLFDKENPGRHPTKLAWQLKHYLGYRGLSWPESYTINFNEVPQTTQNEMDSEDHQEARCEPLFSFGEHWTYKESEIRMKQLFDAKLNEMLTYLKQFKLQRELLFGKTKKRNFEHFKWLIRYQIKGESQNKIAWSLHSSSSNQRKSSGFKKSCSAPGRTKVLEGIHSIAELLDIPLRPRTFPGPGSSRK